MPKKDLDSPEAIRKMRRDINFNKLREEIIEELDENNEIVLSTSLANRVTSRTVSYANDVLVIYFTSWEHNKKILQINANPKVALTLNRIQIEGKAEILGIVTESDYEEIKAIFRKKYSEKYIDTFFTKPEMILVKIIPTSIVKFININKRFHFQVLDLINKNACQMRLEDKDHPKFPL
ncbi:MAG: pyridoxamine 5'-phosphate oxidase family protein [Candidatus Heimdallarchaeota archaeon]